jgi:ADP-ribosylglycohydrolase
MNEVACIGCLLGTAVGDALGLPYEGLSPRRAARLFPDTSKHHLFFGKGMVSDDTEHACFVAQAIVRANGDVDVFRKRLARSLRWWLLGLPAGVGFATLRAIVKLWLGFSPQKSGVFSAGNGPAMRSPIIGVVYGHDPEKLKEFVKASTEITHSDPKAYYAALAVALAAYQSSGEQKPSADKFRATLRDLLPEDDAQELHELLQHKADLANGISGYSYHTVPCVLQVWFGESEDYAKGLQKIVKAGGDTDTAGAIYGGIVGARAGKSGIPASWLGNIIEWPRSIGWIERVGAAVATSERSLATHCPRYFVPGVLLRNLFFLLVVLTHGFRRLAPPYG